MTIEELIYDLGSSLYTMNILMGIPKEDLVIICSQKIYKELYENKVVVSLPIEVKEDCPEDTLYIKTKDKTK